MGNDLRTGGDKSFDALLAESEGAIQRLAEAPAEEQHERQAEAIKAWLRIGNYLRRFPARTEEIAKARAKPRNRLSIFGS